MANIPTDDFGTEFFSSEPAQPATMSKEDLELARVGNSPNWKIIRSYMEDRVEAYKKGLFGEDLSGKDAAIVGQRFLAAMSVVRELESLIEQVEVVTKSVNEVIDGKER